jgi:acetyl/propionyl-CoA carboxylase alpha subunit
MLTSLAVSRRDESSRHILDADESINLGSIEQHSVNPFLNIDLLISTALDTGSHAIHPGYGYLSENADFATRVKEAGLIFIGPSPSSMSTLGDKRSSKKYLSERAPDVPLIPGFSGSSTQAADLEKAARDIGFPVMLKASAGGGGKGMRIVREPSQLSDELARVQSEASRSFGSSDCILEKYVESSKHVEIQIVGDSHGNAVGFFERDCSVQRRHQKVIEESPCPFLTDALREQMGNTAVRIAKLIGYENAGTVEFVVDVKTSQFFFLEVNARLQVEHPITEEMTGIDLVALQLYVAAGGNLKSLPQVQSLRQVGHAIECRLCAEDPQRDFFPEHGKVLLWRPADGLLGPGRDIRYETAVQTGSSVSIYFDSMIAKIVVWAPTRALAIHKIVAVLAQTACVGVKTNQLFLQRCLLQPAFQDPCYDTSFIPRHLDQLLSSLDTTVLKLAEYVLPSLFIRHVSRHEKIGQRPFGHVRSQFRNQRHDAVNVHCDIVSLRGAPIVEGSDSSSPGPSLCLWEAAPTAGVQRSDRMRIIAIPPYSSNQDVGGKPTSSAVRATTDHYNIISKILRGEASDPTRSVTVQVLRWARANPAIDAIEGPVAATIEISIDGFKILAHCATPSQQPSNLNDSQTVFCHFPLLGTWIQCQRSSVLSFIESRRTAVQAEEDLAQRGVIAPMPCKILSIQKKESDPVRAGELVMVIESMKMEVSIRANRDGKFKTTWKAGDAVDEGTVLCDIN